MSAIDPTAIPPAGHEHSAHGHDAHDHAHPPHLAHHFDTPEQQFDSAKIGMWVFLATEILMFGGLFCAYAVYRYNNPQVFQYSEQHLSTMLGAVNTVILLTSSLTMALGVRAAQLGQRGLLVAMLALTLLGGAGFMVIKAVEYTDKWNKGLFPGRFNVYNRVLNPVGFDEAMQKRMAGAGIEEEHDLGPVPGERPLEGAVPPVEMMPSRTPADSALSDPREIPVEQAMQQPGEETPPEVAEAAPQARGRQLWVSPGYFDPNFGTADAASVRPAFNTPTGLAPVERAPYEHVPYDRLSTREQAHLPAFFSIYFMMTGLHGIHVLIGMGLIGWILIRAAQGMFGPAYFTPVDLVGLYWHLVDLIWIFLFPLLYLIH